MLSRSERMSLSNIKIEGIYKDGKIPMPDQIEVNGEQYYTLEKAKYVEAQNILKEFGIKQKSCLCCPDHACGKIPDEVEFELAEDTKELIAKNPDVRISEELRKKLMSIDNNEMVKVQKNFDKGIIILNIDHVTEDYITKDIKQMSKEDE